MALAVASLPPRPQLPPEDQRRAEHQALRLRMLSGTWSSDLEEALQRHISADRRTAWGIPELSRNPFRSLASQVGGALYREPPTVYGDEGLAQAVSQAGVWQLMQRVSTDLVGLREAIIRVDWTERGGLLYRPVPPDQAVIRAVPEAPDVPACVEELQVRPHPQTGKDTWVWEILDITDLDNPIHKILSANRRSDWTVDLLGSERSGAAYPYRDSQGRPYLPVVMYHAERTGRLWDPYYGIEAVLGSLTIGVLLTFWVHGVKDGSFATVLLVGGQIRGVEVRSPSGHRTQVISTEPGSIIEVAPMEEGLQPSAVQLQPGFDPSKLMDAIGDFGAGLAEYAGVSPADLVRTGADPRSGASLSISREGLRAAQARYEPQLRRGDLDLLRVSARVLNGATGSSYAEDGCSISYPSLPLSGEEQRSLREDIASKITLGLMSPIDAYLRLHPGLTRDQAISELQRIQRETAMFRALAPSTIIP